MMAITERTLTKISVTSALLLSGALCLFVLVLPWTWYYVVLAACGIGVSVSCVFHGVVRWCCISRNENHDRHDEEVQARASLLGRTTQFDVFCDQSGETTLSVEDATQLHKAYDTLRDPLADETTAKLPQTPRLNTNVAASSNSKRDPLEKAANDTKSTMRWYLQLVFPESHQEKWRALNKLLDDIIAKEEMGLDQKAAFLKEVKQAVHDIRYTLVGGRKQIDVFQTLLPEERETYEKLFSDYCETLRNRLNAVTANEEKEEKREQSEEVSWVDQKIRIILGYVMTATQGVYRPHSILPGVERYLKQKMDEKEDEKEEEKYLEQQIKEFEAISKLEKAHSTQRVNAVLVLGGLAISTPHPGTNEKELRDELEAVLYKLRCAFERYNVSVEEQATLRTAVYQRMMLGENTLLVPDDLAAQHLLFVKISAELERVKDIRASKAALAEFKKVCTASPQSLAELPEVTFHYSAAGPLDPNQDETGQQIKQTKEKIRDIFNWMLQRNGSLEDERYVDGMWDDLVYHGLEEKTDPKEKLAFIQALHQEYETKVIGVKHIKKMWEVFRDITRKKLKEIIERGAVQVNSLGLYNLEIREKEKKENAVNKPKRQQVNLQQPTNADVVMKGEKRSVSEAANDMWYLFEDVTEALSPKFEMLGKPREALENGLLSRAHLRDPESLTPEKQIEILDAINLELKTISRMSVSDVQKMSVALKKTCQCESLELPPAKVFDKDTKVDPTLVSMFFSDGKKQKKEEKQVKREEKAWETEGKNKILELLMTIKVPDAEQLKATLWPEIKKHLEQMIDHHQEKFRGKIYLDSMTRQFSAIAEIKPTSTEDEASVVGKQLQAIKMLCHCHMTDSKEDDDIVSHELEIVLLGFDFLYKCYSDPRREALLPAVYNRVILEEEKFDAEVQCQLLMKMSKALADLERASWLGEVFDEFEKVCIEPTALLAALPKVAFEVPPVDTAQEKSEQIEQIKKNIDEIFKWVIRRNDATDTMRHILEGMLDDLKHFGLAEQADEDEKLKFIQHLYAEYHREIIEKKQSGKKMLERMIELTQEKLTPILARARQNGAKISTGGRLEELEEIQAKKKRKEEQKKLEEMLQQVDLMLEQTSSPSPSPKVDAAACDKAIADLWVIFDDITKTKTYELSFHNEFCEVLKRGLKKRVGKDQAGVALDQKYQFIVSLQTELKTARSTLRSTIKDKKQMSAELKRICGCPQALLLPVFHEEYETANCKMWDAFEAIYKSFDLTLEWKQALRNGLGDQLFDAKDMRAKTELSLIQHSQLDAALKIKDKLQRFTKLKEICGCTHFNLNLPWEIEERSAEENERLSSNSWFKNNRSLIDRDDGNEIPDEEAQAKINKQKGIR